MATSEDKVQQSSLEGSAAGSATNEQPASVAKTTATTDSKASVSASQPGTATCADNQRDPADEKEAGEIDESASDQGDSVDSSKTYFWCKCPCDPNQYAGVTHYYVHLQISESRWEEPDEPYWLFDSATGQPDPTNLQQPKKKAAKKPADNKTDAPAAEYQGYNPKIHGNYDPNAPYAKYHENKRKEEELAEHRAKFGDAPMPTNDYAATASFNSRTGRFQTGDQSVEHHSDASKSYRQLNAFYDVDAAANAHNGQSLKAERQQQKFSKKEIAEMRARRKEKKMKKKLDWLKS